MRTVFVTMLLSVVLVGTACGGDKTEPQDTAQGQVGVAGDAAKSANPPQPTIVTQLNPTPGGLDPTNAQAVIFHQIEMLREGNSEELKNWFTPRLQESLTPEVLAAAVAAAKDMPAKEQLAQTVEVREEGGKRVATVLSDGGRLFTTMILTDGRWLSDTIWFR